MKIGEGLIELGAIGVLRESNGDGEVVRRKVWTDRPGHLDCQMSRDEADVWRRSSLVVVVASGDARVLIFIQNADVRVFDRLRDVFPPFIVPSRTPCFTVGIPITHNQAIPRRVVDDGVDVRAIITRARRRWRNIDVEEGERDVVDGDVDAVEFEDGVRAGE